MEINPQDILKSIKLFPLFQQKEESKKFVNKQISGYGDLGYCSEGVNKSIHLRLDCDGFSVFCDQKIEDYPQFKDLSLGTRIYFKGEIKEVRPDINSLMMMDCKFEFSVSLIERELPPDALSINMFNSSYEEVMLKLNIKRYPDFDKWLFENKKIQYIICDSSRGKNETLLGHIRHCIHHKAHGKFTKSQLSNAIKILNEIN